MRRIVQRFGPHLRAHRPRLLAAGLCVLGATASELLRPWPLKVVFDVILAPPEQAAPLVERLPWLGEDSALLLALTALSILLLAALNAVFGFGQAYLVASVGQRVSAAIRQRLYSHIQRLSHSFHDANRTGDLLYRLTSDIRMLQEILVNSILFLAERGLVLVGMLAVMLWMDWQLTVVALVALPVLALAVMRSSRQIKTAVRRQRRRESRISNVIAEKISAISLVQAFARQAHEDEAFARDNLDSAEAGIATSRLQEALMRGVQVILAAGTCAVIWFGVTRVQAGQITPGDLLVFAAYMKGLYKPIKRLARVSGRIARATVSGERILAILDIEPDIKDAPDAIAAPPFRGAIEFQDVAFAYRQGAPVLRGVNLRIEPGRTIALVGCNGSGKSTLASLLLRYYDPVLGSVRIDGVDVRRYKLASLREQISVVPQDTVLFHGTIRENIAYGRLDATQREIVAAARAANAHAFIERLPDGYDTVVGERGARLSGGQRQRIAIARAIVRDAPIVVLDEPTTNLDVMSEDAVREALLRLAAHKTCLVITHDFATVLDADRVYALRDGVLGEVEKPLRTRGGGRDDMRAALAEVDPAPEAPVTRGPAT